MLALAGLAAANDYDLVVPRGWDYLKSAKTLVVYSPTGALNSGDRITRIVAGGAEGPGVRVSAGWTSKNSIELAKPGSVKGFGGAIILSADSTGSTGLSGTLVPAGQGATRAPEEGLTQGFPWFWMMAAVGLLVVLSVSATFFRKGIAPASPLRFSGRKGIEEGVREIRAKIDEIQNDQKDLVRKPPVLRSFRKQIDTFAYRLRQIESSTEETNSQLSSIAGTLQRLDERLNTLAQNTVSASGDSKKALEAVTKLSAEHGKRASGFEDDLKKIAHSQEGMNTISRDVAKTFDSVANLASRIDAVAAQNLAQETKLQATTTGIEATRKEIEKLDVRLVGTNQAAEATRKQIERLETRIGESTQSADSTKESFASLGATLQKADQKLASLENQATAATRRDEETRQRIHDVAKATESLERSLLKLDGRLEGLTKSADAVQLNLQDISGRVTNTEGSLHANLAGLASELGTLRNEVGSLPQAMSSLGDRVGSLDARLAPINERGEKLAESFHGLQSRFEEAALGLAKQVDTLEGRLQQIQTEGSKLANLPEVANALHGNTAELAAHVRSAEGGLKNLGEELAKLQEALLNDSKHSDTLADELTQRLEAWEGALAEVSSKVEDLRTPDEGEEDEQAEVRPAKKSHRAAKAKKNSVEVEETPPEAEEPAPAVQQAKPQPVAPPPMINDVWGREPLMFLEETSVAPQPAAEAENREQASEPVAIAQPVAELEEEEEEEIILERSKAGRWGQLAGSSERLWSVKMPAHKPLPALKGPIRPLTPIETPSIDHQIGSLICTGQGAAYAHGDTLRCFWPGSEERDVMLQSPMPNDLWRVMLFGGHIYCVAERQVEIIHTSTWTMSAFFQGDYLNQAHTDQYWAGLMVWGDQLAVDFRDSLGNHVNSPREIEASANEPFHFAASGNSVYVGTRSGSLFRVDPNEAVQLCRPSEDHKLLSISITKAGILAMIQSQKGVAARLISRDGHLLKEADLGCQVMAHAPVVMGDKAYIFDDSIGEMITFSLKNLQVSTRTTLDSVLGVARMLGLSCGKTHMIAFLATDDRGQCTRAFVLDPKSGHEMTLCPINHPRAEMVAGDGHLVIATSSAYQNTIQVFNPFEAVEIKVKKAA
jgi:predicted  nucleic acid-binding Zn-ribbon protein